MAGDSEVKQLIRMVNLGIVSIVTIVSSFCSSLRVVDWDGRYGSP